MAINCFGRAARTGGATNAIDGIDLTNSSVANGDLAISFESTRQFIYQYNSTSGVAEDGIRYIAPDEDGGAPYAGNGRWELIGIVSLANGLGEEEEITISSGTITLNGAGKYVIDTEGAAATDDITAVAGLAAGDQVQLRSKNAARVPTLKKGAGVKMTADFTMNSIYDRIVLECHTVGTVVEISRANNG